MEKYLSLLARSPLFSGIAQGDIESMLFCLGARLGEYSKTETIFMEGESARLLGIVLSGAVQVVRDDYWGSRSVLAILEPGELFGEVFSCAALESLPVSVLALRDCRVLLLDCRRVLSTCPSSCSFHSLLIRNLLQGLALKNLELTRKIHCMSRKTTREKLLAYEPPQIVRTAQKGTDVGKHEVLSGEASRQRRLSSFELDALMVVEVDIAVNHLVGFRESSWFVAVNALCLED